MKKHSITTPLRYPGGKSRAINDIMPMIPEFKEFREPFVGGGSVFIQLKQQYPEKNFWINDFNSELYLLWHVAKTNMQKLTFKINEIKENYKNGRALYHYLVEEEFKDEIDRAARFFVLNRITFSGTTDSGGYSQKAFEGRFTESSINRLNKINPILSGIEITNLDYEELVVKDGNDVFIFLDPPYLSSKKSKLYGKNGNLHFNFDHERFAYVMSTCKHKWLITYDDSPEIRKLFSFANIKEWNLQYGMNNVGSETAKSGKELFVFNY